MPDLFIAGIRRDLFMDRDTATTLRVPPVGEQVLTEPEFEIRRSRVTGPGYIASAYVPTATINADGELEVVITEAHTGAWQDLAGENRVSYMRYRLRAAADGGAVRTFVSGKFVVGPIGFAQPEDDLELPFIINTGDIVFGDVVIVVDPEEPEEPEGDDLADVVLFSATSGLLWETDVYAQWE
jgi:hypothetical protein